MDIRTESSDVALLDLLRQSGPMRVSQLGEAMNVTVTAVRQRLTRLMNKGLIERQAIKVGRGRPHHAYQLTEAGRRQTGTNFADLAVALWEEIRQIKDVEVRRGLLQRLSQRMASVYGDQITGETTAERMGSLVELFGEREIPFIVEENISELPVLKALGCPYTELADQDRTICSMERMMFSEIVGENLRLSECRLDGQACCTFEVAADGDSTANKSKINETTNEV